MDLNQPREGDLKCLFETIVNNIPAPKVDEEGGGESFKFLGTILEVDDFVGRTMTGKIYGGTGFVGQNVKVLSVDGNLVEKGKITRLQTFSGTNRIAVDSAIAGDIVRVSGFVKVSVSDTICSETIEKPVMSYPIDPPTMSLTISPNTSPFAGLEGSKVTSTVIKERLMKEAERNIAIKVTESSGKDAFEVGGRGELQLGVLLETMRREGFELSVSRPKVIFQKDEKGNRTEPIEEVVVDVDEEFSGVVVEKLSKRKGEVREMKPFVGGKIRLVFLVPSRCLIGYRGEFLTDTRGTGILNRVFHSYGAYRGDLQRHRNGVLIATDTGEAVAYALFNLQDRGVMFINPQDKVYQGMIVGEHNRDNDLPINVLKGKQLTNVRASGSDEAIRLSPPRKMTLEDVLSYIEDDEMVEITPSSVRLRKVHLDPNARKRAGGKE
jgi:GTP-binding protein